MLSKAEALEQENTIVLTTVQALWGYVKPNLRGVAVEVNDDGRSITLYFALREINDEIVEDIADIIGEVEGLLYPQLWEVTSSVAVMPASPGWEGRNHRLVLLADESQGAQSA